MNKRAKRAYHREWRRRNAAKCRASQKAYRNQPHVKQKYREYLERPEVRERIRARNRERMRIYSQTPEWKVYSSAYQKEHWRAYRATPYGKAAEKRSRENYYGSPAQRACEKKWQALRTLHRGAKRLCRIMDRVALMVKEMARER